VGQKCLQLVGAEARGGGHEHATVAARRAKKTVLAHRVLGFSSAPGSRSKGNPGVAGSSSRTLIGRWGLADRSLGPAFA
jgi:hypothetical protein